MEMTYKYNITDKQHGNCDENKFISFGGTEGQIRIFVNNITHKAKLDQ